MSESGHTKGHPSWFTGGVLILLALLVGLTWLNGAMINRQHHELQAMREDIQSLADSLDQGSTDDSAEGAALSPSSYRNSKRLLRVQQREEDSEPAMKDLKESRDSAEKAVRDAREVQRKLSIEENARRADEQAKRKAAERGWRPWFYGAIAIVLVAIVVRGWLLRRR